MTSHKKMWVGTVSGRLGIPIIGGPHPYFRKVMPEEPVLLTAKKADKPSARPVERTKELEMGDLEILVDNTQGAAPIQSRAGEPTMEISASQFLEIDGKPVPHVPAPPPKRSVRPPAPSSRPPAEAEPKREHEESGGYSLEDLLSGAKGREDGDPKRAAESSVVSSIENILLCEAERVEREKAAPPAPKPAKKAPEAPQRESESSVAVSLEELKQVHRERVEEEAAAAADEAAEAQLLEANLREALDLGKARIREEGGAGSLLDCEPGAAVPEAGKGAGVARSEDAGPEIEISGGTEVSISIELIFGLPWEDRHSIYRLTGTELQDCSGVLPERETMWVMPVPARDSKDKGDIAILAQFANEARRELNGKEYYIVQGPFAGAKRVARVGDIVHIWPEGETDYEFLGEPSAGFDVNQPQTGEWSAGSTGFILSDEEVARCSPVIPNNKPVFLHPVPQSGGQEMLERSFMESMHGGSVPRVSIGGSEYYVMEIGTIAEWQECAFMYPKLRIASRAGEWLSIWPENEAGRTLMAEEYGFNRTVHGPEGPPFIESGGLVQPYESELPAIKRLHQGSASRWLHPLPEKVGSMESDSLNFLMAVSAKEAEQTGISPLVSIRGRWFISLRYPHPEARESVLEGEKVRINPRGARLKDVLADARAKSDDSWEMGTKPMIVLPPKPEDCKPLLDMFPEGKTRYLYFVDPSQGGYVAMKPHVALQRGAEKEVYLVLNEPYEGAIPVQRKGLAIYPLE